MRSAFNPARLLWLSSLVPLAIQLRNHNVHGPPADYAGLTLASAASWVGLAGPGEALLITSGVLASHSKLNIGPVLLYAWIGATGGGIAGWIIGLKAGRAVVLAPGPLLARRTSALDRGERLYERFGSLAVFLTPSWSAGITGVPAKKYLPANVIAAAVWALLFGMGAFLIGPSVTDLLGDLGLIGGTLLAAAFLVGLTMAWLRRRRSGGNSS